MGVVASLSVLGNDVANLIELQAKLAAFDLEDCKSRIVRPLIGAGVAIVFILGATPVILYGIADVLSRATSLPIGASLLIVGLGVLGTSGIVAALCGLAIGRSTRSFRRSREEFTRNLSWLRTVLIHSGRS